MPYSIKEAAKKLCLTPSTLRFYDKEGLLPTLRRTPTGIRTFSESDLQWLELICCLKNSGMSILDIKHFMSLCLQGEASSEDRKEILLHHKEAILKQMEVLQNSLCIINCKIEHYKEIGIFHIDQ
ncbi:MAG: transcriptional regulator, MerR family [Herbinix sp.]|jgi:DNA-binding transcriptional MerR regulator|nr:transcriptional regulator, MerR family [Herbinix sp.]